MGLTREGKLRAAVEKYSKIAEKARTEIKKAFIKFNPPCPDCKSNRMEADVVGMTSCLFNCIPCEKTWLVKIDGSIEYYGFL